MTNKNKNKNKNNLSSGVDVTTELFVENKKSGGNKTLCKALENNECVLSFGSAHDRDNVHHMNLPLTSLGMGIA